MNVLNAIALYLKIDGEGWVFWFFLQQLKCRGGKQRYKGQGSLEYLQENSCKRLGESREISGQEVPLRLQEREW